MHRNTAGIRTFIEYRFLLQRLSSPILCSAHRSSPPTAMKYTTSPTIIPIPSRAYRIIKFSSKEPTAAVHTVTGRGDLTTALKNNAAYKERSHNTHHRTHVPDIRSRLPALGPTAENKRPPRVAHLGSSSLERFETTGEPVRIILLGDSMFERLRLKVSYTIAVTRYEIALLSPPFIIHSFVYTLLCMSSWRALTFCLQSTDSLTIVPTSALNTRSDAINLGVGVDKIQNVLYRMSLGLLDMLQLYQSSFGSYTLEAITSARRKVLLDLKK